MRWKQQKPERRVAINPPAAWLGAKNAILWGKAKQYHVAEFPGPLSIKTAVRGSALWETSEAAPLAANRYLQRKRLANAQQLLKSSEQSVIDICPEVDFESGTSSSTLFRRCFGCSPREYRSRKSKVR